MMRQNYVNELESVRQNLIRMGDTTIALLSEAIRAVAGSSDSTARASELEAEVSPWLSASIRSLARRGPLAG